MVVQHLSEFCMSFDAPHTLLNVLQCPERRYVLYHEHLMISYLTQWKNCIILLQSCILQVCCIMHAPTNQGNYTLYPGKTKGYFLSLSHSLIFCNGFLYQTCFTVWISSKWQTKARSFTYKEWLRARWYLYVMHRRACVYCSMLQGWGVSHCFA